jgi:membrane protease YdiL (CAAX protease family)
VAEPVRSHAARIRWGIPDALIAWLAGVAISLFAIAPFVNSKGELPLRLQVEGTLTGLVAQSVGIIGALAIIARRKGRGSLRDDFGLAFRASDWLWILGGALLAGIAQAIVLPITELGDIHETQQEVARALERANGWEIAPFVIGTVVIAPVTEELLFRGVLLRGLARRMSGGMAVFVSALAFAFVHPLGDVDTAYAVPAFLLLGLVSGQRALATRSLSQPICLHAGFNLIGSIFLLA